MKKIIYIIVIIAVIVGSVYAWFYFSKNSGSQNNATQTPALNTLPSTQTSSPSHSSLPASYSITDTFPKTDTISIGTGNGAIEVKNFYKNIVDTEEGSAILVDNVNYQISYDRSVSIFYIHFRNASAQQSKAETELLGMLGIGQKDACRLDVLVFQAGQQNGTGLSFCASGVK